jgi:flavin reductase (DIM6/NTAB) family NADH-FMN oxidoreductase RutF
MDIRVAELQVRDRYKLLIGAIVPRPIAVVATVSARGALNLAPFSFFCGVGSNPMTLAFCPGNTPDGGEKDTLRNCAPAADGGNGEFVVNVATEGWARQVAAAAEALPYGESEFELAGLTPVPSSVVLPPRVAESPVAFECRTLQVIRINPGATGGGNLVLGQVVSVHVEDGLLDDSWHLDPERLRAIGRMGGAQYCRTGDRFELPRGRAALEGGDGKTAGGS